MVDLKKQGDTCFIFVTSLFIIISIDHCYNESCMQQHVLHLNKGGITPQTCQYSSFNYTSVRKAENNLFIDRSVCDGLVAGQLVKVSRYEHI